jgi:maleylpyruvate isomerase
MYRNFRGAGSAIYALWCRMAGKLRLYAYASSSMSWAVRMGLAYKAIPFEIVAVDIRKDSDERARIGYHEINAFGQVPVLEWEHAGSVRRTAQSFAILELLEELFPLPRLLPEDRFLRARARELAGMVQSGTQPLQNNYVLAQIKARGADEREWSQHFIARGLHALEHAAQETRGKFLVGDELSVADVYLTPMLFNAAKRGVVVDGIDGLRAVEQNVSALPCYRVSHPDRQP